MSPKLSQLVEVCTAQADDFAAWCEGVLHTFAPLLAPPRGLFLCLADRTTLSWDFLGACGEAEAFRRFARAHTLQDLTSKLGDGVLLRALRRGYRPFRVATFREQAGPLARPVLASLRPFGIRVADIMGIGVVAGDLLLTLYAPLGPSESLPVPRRELLRFQRILTGGALPHLQREWPTNSALVLSETGLVHHLEPCAEPIVSRARALARTFAADLAPESAPDPEGERLWDELWQGGWTVARVTESDGKRLIVAHRTHTPHVALTRLELAVLGLAGRGLALKAIAAESGAPLSTAHSALARALAKLGFEDRLQLVNALGPTDHCRAASGVRR